MTAIADEDTTVVNPGKFTPKQMIAAVIFTLLAIALAMVVLLASWIPARRASRIDSDGSVLLSATTSFSGRFPRTPPEALISSTAISAPCRPAVP